MTIARPKSKRRRYIEELQMAIRQRFPDAQFKVTPMPDSRTGTAIWTYTESEYDDVEALVVGREMELLEDHNVFICVLPMPLEAVTSNGGARRPSLRRRRRAP
jgi:hypothetical protein